MREDIDYEYAFVRVGINNPELFKSLSDFIEESIGPGTCKKILEDYYYEDVYKDYDVMSAMEMNIANGHYMFYNFVAESIGKEFCYEYLEYNNCLSTAEDVYKIQKLVL
jgi:hypothetical protein